MPKREFRLTPADIDERFRHIADRSPDIIYWVGSGGLEYISPACSRILGIPAEELGPRPSIAPTRVHPDDVPKLAVVVSNLDQGPVRCEIRMLHRDGSIVWTEHHIHPFFDDSGKRIAVEGIIRDISDRKRIEEALGRQREEQRMILDAVPAMIWYKDRENRILNANRAAAQSIGRTVDQVVGQSTYDLYPDEAAAYHRDDLAVIESGRPKLGIIEEMSTASGEKRWVCTDKIPYRDERGEITGVVVFAVDITDLKRAEQALECARNELELRVRERTVELAQAVDSLRTEIAERKRAEAEARRQQSDLAHVLRIQTIEGMAAQLAHEINQPLGAIANFANGLAARLRRGTVEREVTLEAAEHIGAQALRAGLVVQRMRDFARKESPKRQPHDLNRLARAAAYLVEPEARQHRIAVRLCLDPTLPCAEIDDIQVEQVILNLLRNGIESITELSTGDDELLIETAASAAGDIEVKVRDTGAGISPVAAERLFEPFFSTKKSGLGMGLSISQSIVAAHGGRLWAMPNGDRGATFGFNLPAFRPDGRSEPEGG